MTWYSEITERIQKTKDPHKTMTQIVDGVKYDLGRRSIEFAEAYWRFVTSQTYGVAHISGLPWPVLTELIRTVSGTDESVVIPSLLMEYLYKRFQELDVGTDIMTRPQVKMEAVQASLMHAWGYGKTVYDIDPAVGDSVLESDMDVVPVEALKHMPYNSMFIPYRINDCVGVFYHRFEVARTGQAGLSFLMVKSGWPNRKPEEPDYCCGTIALEPEGAKSMAELVNPNNSEPLDGDSFRKYMNLLLLLCCKNVEIVGRTTPRPGPSMDKATQRPVATPGPRHWDVGVRQGAALRANAACASESAGEGTGRTVRAHVRRAHWQSFHVGPRNSPERSTVLHWIAPILVGAAADLVETHHKVEDV